MLELLSRENIIEITNVIVEIAIILFYFSRIFEKKVYRPKWLWGLIAFGGVVVLSITSSMHLEVYLNFVTTAILLFGLSTVLFKTSWTNRIFATAIYLLLVILVDTLTTAILSFVFDKVYGVAGEFEFTRVLGMCMTDFGMLCASGLVVRLYNIKVKHLPWNYWIFIVLCPLFSYIVLICLDILLVQAQQVNLVLIVLPVLALIYINLEVFNFFESYSSQLRLGIMEELAAKTEENYKILADNEKELRTIKHDLQNHIFSIEDMINQNKTEIAQKHLELIKSTVEDISSIIYTKNAALDSVLNIEARKAQKAGVKYRVKVVLTDEIRLDPVAICAIFSNAIDNAIEACRDLEQRYVSVNIRQKDDNICVSISNPMKTENLLENLSTTKKDKANHGFGLTSIKTTVKKYGGTTAIKQEDNTFILNILMKNIGK